MHVPRCKLWLCTVEHEVCDRTEQDSLKRHPSMDFASKKKINETDRWPLSFSIKLVMQSMYRLHHFSDSWYKTYPCLWGCKKSSSLYFWPCLIFSTDRNIWIKNDVINIFSTWFLNDHLKFLRRALLLMPLLPKICLQVGLYQYQTWFRINIWLPPC
jgi:hypothetical protein